MPPFKITKGKDQGSATGFQVKDANGRTFMLKLDPAGHLGLTTAAEMIGNRLFHAAGYNVAGAYLVEIDRAQLQVDPGATFKLYKVEKRPLTEARVASQLAGIARLPDGRIRAVAIPWIPGKILGSFDTIGRRANDPNDRIPHEHRRSLRASWVLFAWLSILDPGPINTIDSFVEEGGRHFVRHYFFDFSCAFGSATSYVQGPQQDGEYLIEIGRTLRALFSFGLYQRPFQAKDEREEWQKLNAEYPSIGYFPEDFDPDSFRTNRKVPPHMRLTARDAYWGAKVVTAFSDAQLAAVVATAGLPGARRRLRRPGAARRGATSSAAVTCARSRRSRTPPSPPTGERLLRRSGHRPRLRRRARGALPGRRRDGHGLRLAGFEQAADGPRTCVVDRRRGARDRVPGGQRPRAARRGRRPPRQHRRQGRAHPPALARRRAPVRGGRPGARRMTPLLVALFLAATADDPPCATPAAESPARSPLRRDARRPRPGRSGSGAGRAAGGARRPEAGHARGPVAGGRDAPTSSSTTACSTG